MPRAVQLGACVPLPGARTSLNYAVPERQRCWATAQMSISGFLPNNTNPSPLLFFHSAPDSLDGRFPLMQVKYIIELNFPMRMGIVFHHAPVSPQAYR